MKNISPADIRFMARALNLARRGQGAVEPNPMVGALVVRNNKIVGKGYHRQFGGPHAEVHALRSAGPNARGATLYVTLEPCCHWGKTPPCTDAILAAGITRVVVAMVDPFAAVHGKGIRLLKRRGLQVDVGLLENSARALNAPFITRLTQHRPFVIAKWAQSLDGCIALANGESKWISSETSRAFVQQLRGRMDAILIGRATAEKDDPLLMARPARGADIHRIATRIILDSHCRLAPDSQLARTIPFAPLMIIHAKKLPPAAEKRRRTLESKGAMTIPIRTHPDGRLHLPELLKFLAARDYTNLLVEGGPETMASFLAADLIDEAHIFIAPILIGGQNARHAVGGPDLQKLAKAPRLEFTAATRSGIDVHLTARRPQVEPTPPSAKSKK
ncbi:MAG: bifunctional diaminohydroxyphosphoribosylaminopyrimidine deaminase/5-amino-6-(5-phosphoribosylamino)uracil reductase RibD [Phycisphaerae bacterium]